MNDISSVSNAVEMTCLWSTRPWRMSIDLLSRRENVVPEGLLLLFLCGGGREDFDMVLCCCVLML